MAMSPSYTLRNKRVWVAGDRGLVGSALIRRLQREDCELVTAPRESVDLRRPDQRAENHRQYRSENRTPVAGPEGMARTGIGRQVARVIGDVGCVRELPQRAHRDHAEEADRRE